MLVWGSLIIFGSPTSFATTTKNDDVQYITTTGSLASWMDGSFSPKREEVQEEIGIQFEVVHVDSVIWRYITAEDSFVSSDDLANLINYLQMQAYQGGTLQIWHNLLIRSDRIIGFLVWFASCTVFPLLTTTYKEDPVY